MTPATDALIKALESIIKNLKEEEKHHTSSNESIKKGIQALEDYLKELKKRKE